MINFLKCRREISAFRYIKRGIPSVALSSEDNKSIDERIAFTKRLEEDDDELQVIFTVDLFNEGIDIPSVNTILMLRPTESSIIFIQQLGPGVFQWQSPNSTTQNSEVGQNIIFSYKRGINLHLFVRKFEEVEGVTQPFIYLGKVIPFSDTAEGNKPITIHFALENPVSEELYLDLTTRTDTLGKEI